MNIFRLIKERVLCWLVGNHKGYRIGGTKRCPFCDLDLQKSRRRERFDY